MPTLADALLPALGATGLVLSGAFVFTTLQRDRQELETANAAVAATRLERDNLQARVEELEAALVASAPAPAPAPVEPEAEMTEAPQVAVRATSVESGKELFAQCEGCHQVGAGAENRVGPHLNALFGRVAGSIEGFQYSPSLARAGVNGLEWHADTLDPYIENPRAFASGTRMSFAGVDDPTDRANLIAYLRIFSDDPSNIPEADPTARGTDHDIDPAILAIQGDPEYGEYLSSECTTCHQADGGNDGIPSIVFWPEDDFVVAMHAYKNKQRNHPVMQMIAGRLNDEEIAALAAYFHDLDQ